MSIRLGGGGCLALLVVSCLVTRWSAAVGEPWRARPPVRVGLREAGDVEAQGHVSSEGRLQPEQESSAPEGEDPLQEGIIPARVDLARPELFRVSEAASRQELASWLFGDASAVEGFALEPCAVAPDDPAGLPACARVHEPLALRPELLASQRDALEAQLAVDVAWTLSRLTTPLDRVAAEAIVERGLRWAQRSDLMDDTGEGYFDRYLQALAPWQDQPPRGQLGDTPCQDWHFLGAASEPLQKAIALRSKRFKTHYRVTDGSPALAPGDVVGRFYFADGTSVQVRLLVPLTEERSRERAELRVRNLSHRGPSVLVPGEDGHWRGYSVDLSPVSGAREPLEHPEGFYAWYYPGTLFIPPEDWRQGLGRGTSELAALRRQILRSALSAATPRASQPLWGLEQDVLALLTLEERKEVFTTLLTGPALTSRSGEETVQLLGRVVLSTPEGEFPALERQLTSSGVLEALLASSAPGKVRLGRVFTQKALASFPLVLDSLDSLPVFHLGREGETTHLLDVPSALVSTTRVAPESWDARRGVSLGAEPTLAGEAAGSSERMALYFEPVRQRFRARYLSSVERGPRSRALHPLEWVLVEVHGPQPATHLMTALELALWASVPDTAPVWAAVGRISELHVMYGAVSAFLASAPLSGVATGAARGGTVAAVRQVAARQLIGRLSLVAGLAGVDAWRDELSRTREGRAFLAVHDVALLALAGRDLSKLVTSGLARELVQRGMRVLSQSGVRTSAGLSESVEAARALAQTLERMLAECKAVATPEGLGCAPVGGADAFRQTYFAIRGEMAAARALNGLRGAGLATHQAEATLAVLKQMAAESQDMARAYGAVARRAAALPADKAQSYLAAVDALRSSARDAAKPALAQLLHRSGAPSLVDPQAFLKEAEWLVGHPELDAEAVSILARKACEDRVDLSWLRSTGLTTEDLEFMARDKRMPWRLFRRAATEAADGRLQRQAREQLRGVAGEMLTERNAQKLFPGHRMSGRQVRLEGSHIIDYELTSMDGLRTQHGVEVKGWNDNRWRNALDAWADRQEARMLDKEQEALIKQLQRLLDQLADAAKAPRGRPFLVSTGRLSGPTRFKLLEFLRNRAPSTQLIELEESKLLEKTKQLRAALKMPEDLSGDAP